MPASSLATARGVGWGRAGVPFPALLLALTLLAATLASTRALAQEVVAPAQTSEAMAYDASVESESELIITEPAPVPPNVAERVRALAAAREREGTELSAKPFIIEAPGAGVRPGAPAAMDSGDPHPDRPPGADAIERWR